MADSSRSYEAKMDTIILDPDLNVVRCDEFWTESICRLGKLDRSSIGSGLNLSSVTNESFVSLWLHRFQSAVQGKTVHLRVVLTGEAGGGPVGSVACAWDTYVMPVHDRKGAVSCIMGIALRVRESVESAVLESLPDMCFVLNSEGVVAGCHGRSLAGLFGPAGTLMGRSIVDVVPRTAKGRVRSALNQVMAIAKDVWESNASLDAERRWNAKAMPALELLDTADGDGVVAAVEFSVGSGYNTRTYEARFTPFSEPGFVVMIREVTEARRALAIQTGQSRFLELLARGGEFSEVLASLVRILEEQFPGMSGLILLLDPGSKRLRVGASVSLPWEYVDTIEGLQIGPNAGSCGTAAYTGERVIVEDIATDPRWAGLRDLALKYGLRSCWSQPVLDESGEVLGTFAMYYRTVRTPSPVESKAIEIAARLVKVAVEQRRAREEVEAAYEQLERKVEERTGEIEQRRRVAEGLREILAALNSARPLADVLDLILEQAEEFLHSEAGALYQLHGDGMYLKMAAYKGFAGSSLDEQITVGDGVVGWAVASGRPVVVSGADQSQKVMADQLLSTSKLPDWAEGKFRTVMAVPLVGKGRSYGVIALCFAQPRWFSRDELELAVSFADQAALAIENAELRSKAEEAAAAAERSRLARDLHDAVTQTLFSASLISEVLPRIWAQNPDEGKRRLDELRRLNRGALAEMRSLLLELRPSTLMEVDLSDLLRQLAEATMGRSGIPVNVDVSGGQSCQLPPGVRVAFYRIAQESLSNVVKHSRANSAWVGLVCDAQHRDQSSSRISATLSIRDNGVGFDATSVSAEHMGLRIMTERAEGIGASVSIASEPGNGTRIEVAWSGPRWEDEK